MTTFDALHDMGDPLGAARHVHDVLADDGVWMIVEPMAGDRVEDNLNPVGRTYYGFSTLLCTPASLSQDVALALGTQAGPARIREITEAAGSRSSAAPRRRRSTGSWRSGGSGTAGRGQGRRAVTTQARESKSTPAAVRWAAMRSRSRCSTPARPPASSPDSMAC